MPRIPTTINSGNLGTSNAATRTGLAPSTQARGPAQAREQFPIRALNHAQSAARVATSKATALPFGDGNYIPAVPFTAGTPVILQHSLGRNYTGFMALNISGGYGVFQRIDPTDTRLMAAQIKVQANVNCTADIWVW